MAEVDTLMLSREHSDIRKEAVDHTNEIVRENLKGDFNTASAIKDARYDLASTVENVADRLQNSIVNQGNSIADRFYSIGRDTSDLRAQVTQVLSEVKLTAASVAKDNEIAVLKNTIEGQKNTTYLSDKISNDGEKTRGLINELKYGDLNRMLIERQSELAACCGCERRGFGRDDGQIATQLAVLQNQVQAFASQLSETRQGMVNFGTMAGVGQTSTANNVR